MKTLSQTEGVEITFASITPLPIKVCMSVLGTARTDYRVLREAKALAEAGYSVSVVDVEMERAHPPNEDFQGIYLKHIVSPGWFVRTRFKPWFFVKMVGMILRTTLILLHTTADVYHAHDENALPACYLAARLRRRPLIFDAHELPLENNPNFTRWPRLTALAKRLFAAALPYCAGVIATSTPTAKVICQEYQVPKVTLVRNFPPYRQIQQSNRIRQYLDLGSEKRVVLFQGYLQAARGLDRLIQAAPFINPDTVVVIMGQDQRGTKAQLETLITKLKVADRVKFIPPVPYTELLDWTASADVGLTLVSPDYARAGSAMLPNKLFEYLMSGLPVLAAPSEAVAEFITTREVGRMMTSLEPEDIAREINEMVSDIETLTCMSSNGLKAARNELNWEKEKEHLLDLYNRILAEQDVAKERRAL